MVKAMDKKSIGQKMGNMQLAEVGKKGREGGERGKKKKSAGHDHQRHGAMPCGGSTAWQRTPSIPETHFYFDCYCVQCLQAMTGAVK